MVARELAERVLPQRLVDRLAEAQGKRNAQRQRRSWEQRLDSAPQDFERAYRDYWQSGEVPEDAGERLFLATWGSGGEFPRSITRTYAPAFIPDRYDVLPAELLTGIDVEEAARAVAEEGYYRAPMLLDSSIVDDISAVLDAGPAQPRGDGIRDLPPGPPAPTAPTWWMDPPDAIRSEGVRRLLQDRTVAQIAGRYLEVDPIIVSLALWKSFAWNAADKTSAQEFHFDGDRASFIKLFVYLTDVSLENGPHVYVPRSHRAKPKELLHGDRLSDDDVARFFPRDTWATITGERGTVFFADTQGFHKGGRLTRGHRSMFQINVASDRFGVTEQPAGSVSDAPADLRSSIAAVPRYFGQIFESATPAP